MIMRPVITISLNGNSYQLEQEGYEALRAYLATAEARLADNPDKAEILADLEQALAEQALESRVERAFLDLQQIVRDLLDVFRECVAVHGPQAERLKNHELECARKKIPAVRLLVHRGLGHGPNASRKYLF